MLKTLRRCQNPPDGAVAISFEPLIPENEIHAHPANFDDIAVIEANRPGNGCPVDRGNLVARSEVIAVIALINLGGQLRLEPALEAHRSHPGLTDNGQL